MYEADVMNLLQNDLFKSHDTALLTGGSMMYIDAVCKGIDDIPTIRDDIRQWMKERLEKEGLEKLVEELQKMDPEHYNIVDKKNPRRVVHALEICHQTGKTYTSFRTAEKKERPFRIIKIGLNRDRAELYERINQRVLLMMEEGLLEEVNALRLRGLKRESVAMQGLGYKELFGYFEGEYPLEEAVRIIKRDTRHFAKRQLTWFRRERDVIWLDKSEIGREDEQLIQQMLTVLKEKDIIH